jgi:hypothetical protein
MPIGERVNGWLKDLADPPSARRAKAADKLLGTSERYFNDKKVTSAERQGVLENLAPLAADGDAAVRRAVAHLTGLLQHWSGHAEAILRALLRDTSSPVQAHAVWAAGHIGTPASPLARDLLPLAKHPDRAVRWRVPWALSKIARVDAEVAQCALGMFDDADPTARMYAVGAAVLCSPDPSSTAVQDAVLRRLQDPAGEVRGAACRALVGARDSRPGTLNRLRQLVEGDVIAGDAVFALTHLDRDVLSYPAVRRWLERNRGVWWVDDLLNAGKVAWPTTKRAIWL